MSSWMLWSVLDAPGGCEDVGALYSSEMSTGHTSCMHIVLGKPPAAQLQLFPSMALPPRASLQGRIPSTLSPPRLPCSLFLLVSHIYFPYLEGKGEWMEIVLLLLLAIGVYISVSLIRLCVLAHLTCCAPELDRGRSSLIQQAFGSSFPQYQASW